jgi:hypothetical protein
MRILGRVGCLLAATLCAVLLLAILLTKMTSGDASAYVLMALFAIGAVFFYWVAGRVDRPERAAR